MKARRLKQGMIWGALVFGLCSLFEFLDQQATGGFRPAAIEYGFTSSLNYGSLPQEDEPPKHILSQSFSFLGHGHQSYAFVSQDGQYVIKFFKFHPYRFPWFHALNPVNWIKPDPHFQLRQQKLERVFVGYQLAFEHDRLHTGLLYIHLCPSTGTYHSPIEVKDWLGLTYEIDLDATCFVIQQKALTTRQVFNYYLRRGEIDIVKARIDSLLAMYVDEYQKGLFDHDHNLIDNTGFVDDQAIRIDVGKLTQDPQTKDPVFVREDLEKIGFKRLGHWFSSHYPQEAPALIEHIHKKLKEIFSDL